jgi:hypothetical protein
MKENTTKLIAGQLENIVNRKKPSRKIRMAITHILSRITAVTSANAGHCPGEGRCNHGNHEYGHDYGPLPTGNQITTKGVDERNGAGTNDA